MTQPITDAAAAFDAVKTVKGKRMRPRYKSHGEIAVKVDRAMHKIDTYTIEVLRAEERYKYLIQNGAAADAAIEKEKAERLNKQIEYQREKRLPKLRDLSGKLATDLLPWDGNEDRSVA